MVPWFYESRNLFMARSKINYTLASLGPPKSKFLAKLRIYPGTLSFEL